jgi:hypothetical protein
MVYIVNDEVKRVFAPHTLHTHWITFGHEYAQTGSLVNRISHRYWTVTAYWYKRQLQISCNEPSGSINGEEISRLAALLLASQGLCSTEWAGATDENGGNCGQTWVCYLGAGLKTPYHKNHGQRTIIWDAMHGVLTSVWLAISLV